MRIGHCAYLTLREYGVLEQSVLERAAQKALDSCECGVRQRAIFHQLFKDRPTFIRQASDYNLYRGTCEVLGQALLHIGRAVVLWLPSGKF